MRVAILGLLLCAALGCGSEFQSASGGGGKAGNNTEGGNGATGNTSEGGETNVDPPEGGRSTGGHAGESPVSTGGGESVSDKCPIAPCGGDVVGTWQISSVCTDWRVDPATRGTCPTGSSINDVQMSGTYTYGADGSFAWDTKTGGTTTVTLPAECVTDFAACTDLEVGFTVANGYQSGSCAGKVTTACTCTAKLVDEPSKGTGTYKTSGNVLTAILGSDSSSSSYCVKGTKLTTQYDNATSNVVTTIVATKL